MFGGNLKLYTPENLLIICDTARGCGGADGVRMIEKRG